MTKTGNHIENHVQNAKAAVEFLSAEKIYNPGGPLEFRALKPLNLRIEQGDFFGLLGPNGAGKTTAINLLGGVSSLTSGKIEVLGYDVSKDQNTCKRLLGIVSQELIADSFFPLKTMLKLQSKLSGVVPDNDWIDFLLERLALKDHIKKTTRELSGGMKRRMMIARALVHKPRIVVLDEPTAGVDVELRHSMWEFISELHALGLSIILTTHYLEEAEQFCNRLAIIKAGELVTLKSNKDLLRLGGSSRIIFVVQPENGELDAKTADRADRDLDTWLNSVVNSWAGELATCNLKLTMNVKEHATADHQGLLLFSEFDEKDVHSFSKSMENLQKFVILKRLKVVFVTTAKPSLEQVFLKLAF